MRYFYLCLLFVITGCTTVKRYKSIADSKEDNASRVDLSIFGLKIEPATAVDNSKTLWDLSGEGQAELIKNFALRSTDTDKLTALLNTKYLKASEKPSSDFTSKNIQMIFSVKKNRDFVKIKDSNPPYTSADRIEYLQFSLTIPKSIPLKFVKWNKFVTEYGSADVADLTFNQSLEATAGTGISTATTSEKTDGSSKTTASGGTTPYVSVKGTITKNEVQKVKYRYVALNGKMQEKSIDIEQEGMREIDLTGNIATDLSMKFDEMPQILFKISDYKKANGTYSSEEELKAEPYTVMVPDMQAYPDSITAKLKYSYAYRHVKKGAETFYEWDDVIEYYNCKDEEKDIVLFRRKDFAPDFYTISKKGEDQTPSEERTRIVIQSLIEPSDIYELVFDSYDSAQNFKNWLLKFKPAKKGDSIKIGEDYQLLMRKNNLPDAKLTQKMFIEYGNDLQVLPYYR
ncbi:hypothetical protein N4T20_17050 [Flavobacterium sp. TR2]|uniref:hypothetical protein n=1 Tax=Flavobacterium sp. TR2 TaxID=2977321 RepID=UPI0021B139E0|nr:hypothetical protein [Flavobacterium sp. TR2]UWY27426.1 hypothetical protein N4T20_17050 [Flavobacterium sp. TR2]